ncbi:MAG TPA: hypothetical protein VGT24_01525 [Candidatus Acidoferrales bacterium]|nr:hypothetical protein [Candidatus Acidoferrales bacterium]
MPPAIIAAVIGAAASTAELGAQLAGVGQPSTGISPTQKLKTALANKNTQAATLANDIPNIEGQTGGSVSPQYAAKVAEAGTGTGGASGSAENAGIAEIFGNLFGNSEGLG